jgi:Phosphomannomutase
MEKWILNKELPEPTANKGKVEKIDIYDAFINNLTKFYDKNLIKPLKVVCDAGNGCVGIALEKIEKYLPIEMIKVHFEPNGDFPGYRARIRNHGHSCFLCEIVIRSQFHTTYEPEA